MKLEQVGTIGATQFCFVPAGGDLTLTEIPVWPKTHGDPPRLLSQSSLESEASRLDLPQRTAGAEKELSASRQLKIVTGIGFHEIALAASLWRAITPPIQSRTIKADYYHNLAARMGRLVPTLPRPTINRLVDILRAPELVMPRLHGDQHEKAKRRVYDIIAEKVEAGLLDRAPFTATPPFEEFGIIFPGPEEMTALWTTEDQSAKLHQRAQGLFEYHEEGVLLAPIALAMIDPKIKTRFAGELRVTAKLPENIIWSARFDEFSRGFNYPDEPKRRVTIYDFKTDEVGFPPKDSYRREALRASVWLDAMVVAALPDFIPPEGKGVKVNVNLNHPVVNTAVKVEYLGFKRSPPQKIDFDDYWDADWKYPGRQNEEKERFFDLVATIANRADRLEPLMR